MDDDELSVIRLQRQHHLAVVQLICGLVIWFEEHGLSSYSAVPLELRLEGEKVRDELMNFLNSSNLCQNVIRMSPLAFRELCDILVKKGGLRPTLRVTVEEQVAKSLWLLGHGVLHREISFFFRHSGETVSRHFHKVLDAIIALGEVFMRQPDGSHTPLEISSKNRFYPYFKDCIGAIDGTHVRVKVSNVDAPRYRGRKEHPTQNVLAACTFDLKFTYVLVGWEGTTPDSRILKNALEKQIPPLRIPEGKYYLVDAGFMLRCGLITPYRGERYHLKEYSKNPPRSPRELFNHRHASLRNAIERTFGVVKKRFPIIGSTTEPHYDVATQNQIILSCCILHNYLMGVDPSESILAEVDRELRAHTDISEENDEDIIDETREGEKLRDSIAAMMWIDYIS